jgi:hypothetical protein
MWLRRGRFVVQRLRLHMLLRYVACMHVCMYVHVWNSLYVAEERALCSAALTLAHVVEVCSVYVCMHMCGTACMYACTCVEQRVCMHAHVWNSLHVCMHMCGTACMYACTFVEQLRLVVYAYIHIDTYIHTYAQICGETYDSIMTSCEYK